MQIHESAKFKLTHPGLENDWSPAGMTQVGGEGLTKGDGPSWVEAGGGPNVEGQEYIRVMEYPIL